MITKGDNGLYQYKGGGYDGCFWEWNYCAIWQDEFFDLASSGRNAIKSLKQLMDYDDTLYHYNLDSESLKEFANESNPLHVLKVSEILQDEFGIEVFGDCTECSEEFFIYEASLDGWRSCGGIEIEPTQLICPDCINSLTCECCNEFDNTTEIREDFNESLWCDTCYESVVKQKESDQLEWFESEINHIAFTNGHILSAVMFDNCYCINCKAQVNFGEFRMDESLMNPC
jgi:hypothetical protein